MMLWRRLAALAILLSLPCAKAPRLWRALPSQDDLLDMLDVAKFALNSHGGNLVTRTAATCDTGAVTRACSGAPPPGTSPEEVCHNACFLAMVACADDPKFVATVTTGPGNQGTISNLLQEQRWCAAGSGEAGDGVCNMLDLHNYAPDLDMKDETAVAMILFHCDSPLAKELFDCVDDPALASLRPRIRLSQSYCSYPTTASCMTQFAQVSTDLNGICCRPDKSDCTGTEMPAVCSLECSTVVTPFLAHCSKWQQSLFQAGGISAQAAQQALSSLQNFASRCPAPLLPAND